MKTFIIFIFYASGVVAEIEMRGLPRAGTRRDLVAGTRDPEIAAGTGGGQGAATDTGDPGPETDIGDPGAGTDIAETGETERGGGAGVEIGVEGGTEGERGTGAPCPRSEAAPTASSTSGMSGATPPTSLSHPRRETRGGQTYMFDRI